MIIVNIFSPLSILAEIVATTYLQNIYATIVTYANRL